MTKHNFYTIGGEYLERLGMFDYRAGVYDPIEGRFVEVDPILQKFSFLSSIFSFPFSERMIILFHRKVVGGEIYEVSCNGYQPKAGERERRKLLLLLAISLILSCAKSNNKHNDPKESITIPKQGGYFSAFNGDISLKIPEGALSEDVVITVQKIYENLPPGNIGPAYRISPDLKFKKPSVIEIRAKNNNTGSLKVGFLDGSSWKPLPLSWFDSEKVRGETDHLSTWGVLEFSCSISSTTASNLSPKEFSEASEVSFESEAEIVVDGRANCGSPEEVGVRVRLSPGVYELSAVEGAISFACGSSDWWIWAQGIYNPNGEPVWTQLNSAYPPRDGCSPWYCTPQGALQYVEGTLKFKVLSEGYVYFFFADGYCADNHGYAKGILRKVAEIGCDETCGISTDLNPSVDLSPFAQGNLQSGNLFISFDLEKSQDEFFPGFSVFYNSNEKEVGEFGPGFSHTFSSHLHISDQKIELHWFDGKVIEFFRKGEVYLPEVFSGSQNFRRIEKEGERFVLELKGKVRYIFDLQGRLVKIEDTKGRLWSISRDASLAVIKDPVGREWKLLISDGKVVDFENPLGAKWNFEYVGNELVKIKDPVGNTVEFVWSGGKIARVKNFDGYRWDVEYYPDGKVEGIKDPLGRANKIEYLSSVSSSFTTRRGFTSYTYFDAGLKAVTRFVDSEGGEWLSEYDRSGNRTKFQDARGFSTFYEYDERGNLVKETDPLGNSRILKYNELDLVAMERDKLSRETKYFYDERGNLVRRRDPAGNEWKYKYNDLGLLVEEEDPLGARTRYEYDNFGHLSKKVDALGNVWLFEYDVLGRLIRKVTPKGISEVANYDELNRLTIYTNPIGGKWEFRYLSNTTKVATFKNPIGGIYKINYDFNGKLTMIVDPYNNVKKIERDSDGNIIYETNFRGETTIYRNDSKGRPIKIINPLGGEESLSYDLVGNLTEKITSLGLKVVKKYDAVNRLIEIIESGSGEERITKYVYDAEGNLLEIDENGILTRYEYDLLGRIISVVDSLGRKTKFEYDPLGRITAEIDHLGNKVEFRYDNLGSLVKIMNKDGSFEEYNYDSDGNLVRVVDKGGIERFFIYDEMGLLLEVKDREGNTVAKYSYNTMGLPTFVYEPGINMMFEYNLQGNIIKETINGIAIFLEYDPEAHPIIIKDSVGRIVTKTLRNAFGCVTEKYLGETIMAEIEYLPTSDCLPLLRKYSKGGLEKFEYDKFGRLISYTDITGNIEKYRYDILGNISEVETIAGTVKYIYDHLGRIKSKIYPDGRRVEYYYDELDRIEVIRGYEAEIENVYDNVSRLIERTFKIPGMKDIRVKYAYDYSGNKIEVKDPFGKTEYVYDGVGNISKVISDGIIIRFEYDSLLRIKSIIYPNGVIQSYTYDPISKLLSSISLTKEGEILKQIDYKYDLNGHLSIKTEKGRDGELESEVKYEYDPIGRLILSEVKYATKPQRNHTFRFEYDEANNIKKVYLFGEDEGLFDPRLKRPLDKHPVLKHSVTLYFTYNKSFQLTELLAQRMENNNIEYIANFEYDTSGNLTRKVIKKVEDDEEANGDEEIFTTTYKHRFDSKIETIHYPNNNLDKFLFLDDKLLKRTFIEEGEEKSIFFIYDEENILLELDNAGVVIKRYLLSPSSDGIFGTVLYRDKENENKVLFYHRDHINSVFAITDLNGKIVAEYKYSPFGDVLEAIGPYAKKNDILFAARKYIQEAGVYNFKARIYDPRIQRFLEMDPWRKEISHRVLPDELNPYTYAMNNPIMRIDPSGKRSYYFCAVGTCQFTYFSPWTQRGWGTEWPQRGVWWRLPSTLPSFEEKDKKDYPNPSGKPAQENSKIYITYFTRDVNLLANSYSSFNGYMSTRLGNFWRYMPSDQRLSEWYFIRTNLKWSLPERRLSTYTRGYETRWRSSSGGGKCGIVGEGSSFFSSLFYLFLLCIIYAIKSFYSRERK